MGQIEMDTYHPFPSLLMKIPLPGPKCVGSAALL